MRPETSEFEVLVREHHAAVYASAQRLVRHEADALDVVQKVFLAVLEGKVNLAAAESPRKLLCWLAVKTALMQLRSAERARKKEAMRAMSTNEPTNANPEFTPDDGRALAHALERLPDDLRIAVELRFREALTFSQIGEAVGIGEPTAHDRVRRGLERLRATLSRTAYSAMGESAFEHAIGATDVVGAPPAGLERSLLALKAAPVALTIGAAPIILVIALAIGAGVFWNTRSTDTDTLPKSPSAAPAVGAVGPRRANGESAQNIMRRAQTKTVTEVEVPIVEEGETVAARAGGTGLSSTLVPPPNDGSTRDATAAAVAHEGTIVGRIRDEKGAGVADALVYAESREWVGKMPRFSARTYTNAEGEFRVAVPVPEPEGREYAIGLRHAEFLPFTGKSFTVAQDKVTEAADIVAFLRSTDRAGDWSLDLCVLDDTDSPQANVAIGVNRRMKMNTDTVGLETEASGTTDANGRVHLVGKRLGERVLVVNPFNTEFLRTEQTIGAIEGTQSMVVRLVKGKSIAGKIETLDGGKLRSVSIHAIGRNESDWIQGTLAKDGTFKIIALEDRAYTLVVGSYGRYSSGRLENVPAGKDDVVIRLKKNEDATDVGIHDAEIHGVVKDAATGEIVEYQGDQVDVIWFESKPGDDVVGDLFPNHYEMPSKQVAFISDPDDEGDGAMTITMDGKASAFHFTGLRDATYAIAARIPGYGPTIVGPFRMNDRRIEANLVIEVRRGATVSGKVVDADGKPVKGALVFTTGIGPHSDAQLAIRTEDLKTHGLRGRGEDTRPLHPASGTPVDGALQTDADGRFTFTDMPVGVRLRIGVVDQRLPGFFSDVLEMDEKSGAKELTLRFANKIDR